MRADSPEVTFAAGPRVRLRAGDIHGLKEKAKASERDRARFCAHMSVDDDLHEMIIVKTRDAYVRPHKNLKKRKSFHIIEGEADLLFFDDTGNVIECCRMGDYHSGDVFFYRLSHPGYHTLLIRSDWLVFQETTNGPFKTSDTVYASWAPDEKDATSVTRYVQRLRQVVDGPDPLPEPR